MMRTLAYLALAMSMVLPLSAVAQPQAEPTATNDDKTVVVIIDAANTDLLVESLIRSTAESELRARGFTIVERAEVGGEIPGRLLACAGNPQCSVETLSGIESRYVIFISLRPDEEGSSNNFKIVARNYEVATGTALARTMRRCAECEEEVDLAAFSEGVIVDLIRDPKPAEPVIVASSTSEGFEEAPEVPEAPSLSAEPARVEPPRNEAGGGSFIQGLKYATLVGGVAGLSSGTILVLIDGPVIRNGRRLPEERATLTGGYVSLGAGAVLLGVSAWLWSRDYERGAGRRTTFVPSATKGGGSVVWTGRF